jgi:hypothetical protein
MTDKSVFTDEEWHAIVDAPLLITAAMWIPGEHGPISLMKEAAASARAISRPGERGPANALIGEIVAAANTKETRHEMKEEMKEHRGPTPEAAIDSALDELKPAAAALKKLPADESAQVAAWFVDIAKAVASSAKTVNETEQATIDKIAAVFGAG